MSKPSAMSGMTANARVMHTPMHTRAASLQAA
jgi:hypothetical protein